MTEHDHQHDHSHDDHSHSHDDHSHDDHSHDDGTQSTTDLGIGTTRPAGEGVSDQEMVEQVGDQTASDLKVKGFFERESDGAQTDTEAAEADADELA
jgi:hypothetical protein